MARDMYLHPDTVEDIVQELLDSDFINKNEMKKLKTDTQNLIDLNILFDLRHSKRKNNNIEDTNGCVTNLERRRNKETCLNTKPKVKDLKRIDKEISNTKRHLDVFQAMFDKKKEKFDNDILKMESIIKKKVNLPNSLSLEDDESKHYFVMHLERLENGAPIVSKQKQKIWKPVEPQNPPIINVITTVKTLDAKPSSIEFDEEEKFILKMITDPDFEMSKPSDCSLNNFSTDLTHPFEPTTTNKIYDCDINREDSTKTKHLIKKVIEKWKLYVRKNIVYRIITEKESKLKANLMRKYFTLWIHFSNKCKLKKEERVKHNKFVKNNHETTQHSHKMKLENKQTKHKEKGRFNIQSKVFVGSIIIGSFINFSDQQNAISYRFTDSKQRNHKLINEASYLEIEKQQANSEPKMGVNIVNLEDVDLLQSGKIDKKDLSNQTSSELKKECVSKKISKPKIEDLSCRYAAQQKIISKQLAIIEEQKLLISNLKAQHLETKSKLSLKTAEYQLKDTVSIIGKRFKPAVKVIKAGGTNFTEESKDISNHKIVDNSEMLTQRLMERQEHCKHLAELTRMRKLRMEEEQAKIKLEEEERLKRLKEEEKLQMKMKQTISMENKRKLLESKQKINEINEIAKNHYEHRLRRKYFNKFQKVMLNTKYMTENCTIFYEKKLLGKCVSLWRSEVNLYIELKYNSADRHYHRRLLQRSWQTWLLAFRKYQIKTQEIAYIYSLNLERKMLKSWIAFTSQQLLETSFKMELAERLHRRHLLKHTFHCWKQLPRVMLIEYKRERQRRAWRLAVREVVPDFNPIMDDDLKLD